MATNQAEPILFRVEGLNLRIGPRVLIDEISISLKCGQRIGFCGPSGIGKTTLIRGIISGHWPHGSTYKAHSPLEVPVYYSAQTPNLPPEITARRLLRTICDSEDKYKYIIDYLQLTGAVAQRFGSLSGGEQQRLAIAIASISHTNVFCFDEPATGLDADMKYKSISALTYVLSSNNVAGIFISHDPFILGLLCDIVIVLDNKHQSIAFTSPYPRTISNLTDGIDREAFTELAKTMWRGTGTHSFAPCANDRHDDKRHERPRERD